MSYTPAFCGDHLVPIDQCDCLSYMREITTSAERLIQLAKERGVKQVKAICKSCGWEITDPKWWNCWDNIVVCDDCDLDEMIAREKESASGQR